MSADAETKENYYGSELLIKTVESSIKKKADVVVLVVHYVLTKNANLRCVGLGDSKVLEEDDVGSELLPDDWNVDDNKYALRYSHNKVLYILFGHITEGALILNLLNVEKRNASNVCFEPNEVVKALKGSLFDVIPTAESAIKKIQKELVEPVFPGAEKSATTQTFEPEKKEPVSIGEHRPRGQFVPRGLEPRPFGFPDIGRSDLDPLGRIGSGMLFNMQPRYDPIGPLHYCATNPNPDHFAPPGFGHPFI